MVAVLPIAAASGADSRGLSSRQALVYTRAANLGGASYPRNRRRFEGAAFRGWVPRRLGSKHKQDPAPGRGRDELR